MMHYNSIDAFVTIETAADSDSTYKTRAICDDLDALLEDDAGSAIKLHTDMYIPSPPDSPVVSLPPPPRGKRPSRTGIPKVPMEGYRPRTSSSLSSAAEDEALTNIRMSHNRRLRGALVVSIGKENTMSDARTVSLVRTPQVRAQGSSDGVARSDTYGINSNNSKPAKEDARSGIKRNAEAMHYSSDKTTTGDQTSSSPAASLRGIGKLISISKISSHVGIPSSKKEDEWVSVLPDLHEGEHRFRVKLRKRRSVAEVGSRDWHGNYGCSSTRWTSFPSDDNGHHQYTIDGDDAVGKQCTDNCDQTRSRQSLKRSQRPRPITVPSSLDCYTSSSFSSSPHYTRRIDAPYYVRQSSTRPCSSHRDRLPPSMISNFTSGRSQRRQSGESFIDLISPAAMDFPQSATEHDTNLSDNAGPKTGLKIDTKPVVTALGKPSFLQPRSARKGKGKSRSPSTSRHASPNVAIGNSFAGQRFPPTTNHLNAHERADLVRKTKKLAQVFGQTPDANSLLPLTDDGNGIARLAVSSNAAAQRNRHQRAAQSMSENAYILASSPSSADWPPPLDGTRYVSASGRRHSDPMSPDHLSFLADHSSDDSDDDDSGTEEGKGSARAANAAKGDVSHDGSRDDASSFVDFSDEAGGRSASRAHSRKLGHMSSPSAPSFFDIPTPEEAAELERRRKRDKLAKLHRFLGSRVPADLVIGSFDLESSLPEVVEEHNSPVSEDEGLSRWRMKRKRDAGDTPLTPMWFDDLDWNKAELDTKEKALNVRRAHKMEQVFGEAPPQTLYHTRQPHKASSTPAPQEPGSPQSPTTTSSIHSTGRRELLRSGTPSPTTRNINQSAYFKSRHNRWQRQSSESHYSKLPNDDDDDDDDSGATNEGSQDTRRQKRRSSVYNHYQHSLHSLNDIIDRDDRESLAELHQYLNESQTIPEDDVVDDETLSRRPSMSSVRTERRRSLPERPSISSLRSEFETMSITSPQPEVTEFQVRRRRAAKLTHFFGVNYRDLVEEVIDSIEKGVEEERHRGTLQPDEVEDLRQKLRLLKLKRGGLPSS